MNQIIKDIGGIVAMCSLAFPFITLAAIIVYKAYRKFRPARQKAQIEKQPERKLEKPPSIQRTTFNFIGITILLAFVGLLIGSMVSIFSNLIYIVFLFPLGMGLIGGGIVADAIRIVKLRKTYQLIFISLLMAVMMYAAFHYGRYIALQVQTSLEMFPGLSEASEDKNLQTAKVFLDYALEQETGYPGFVGYMLIKADEGVSIGRFYRSSRVNLGPILTWLYWMLEFGIILYVMIIMGKKQAGKTFCESCGNWLGGEKHLGGTAQANESLSLNLIKQKDFVGLRKLLVEDAEMPSVEIYFQGCEACNESNSRLVVRRAFPTSKGSLQFTDISQTILQPIDRTQLLNQLKLVEN